VIEAESAVDGGNDYFKLSQISGRPSVPEPATVALVALGVLGLFARRRT
jgi:hypothetical protein